MASWIPEVEFERPSAGYLFRHRRAVSAWHGRWTPPWTAWGRSPSLRWRARAERTDRRRDALTPGDPVESHLQRTALQTGCAAKLSLPWTLRSSNGWVFQIGASLDIDDLRFGGGSAAFHVPF